MAMTLRVTVRGRRGGGRSCGPAGRRRCSGCGPCAGRPRSAPVCTFDREARTAKPCSSISRHRRILQLPEPIRLWSAQWTARAARLPSSSRLRLLPYTASRRQAERLATLSLRAVAFSLRLLPTRSADGLPCRDPPQLPIGPRIYLGAVALTMSPAGLTIGGTGEVVDCLVVLRRLDEFPTLDRALADHRVQTWQLDRLAATWCNSIAGPSGCPADILWLGREACSSMRESASRHAGRPDPPRLLFLTSRRSLLADGVRAPAHRRRTHRPATEAHLSRRPSTYHRLPGVQCRVACGGPVRPSGIPRSRMRAAWQPMGRLLPKRAVSAT
jgi:hypothetical protein